MFDYTRKLTLDTFDYIKKVLFIFDLFFQIFYIAYLSYKIYTGTGLFFANIILLILSVFYFIFFLCVKHEFNTKKELRKIKKVKEIIKITKRIVNLFVIIIAIVQLIKNPLETDNLDLLLTIFMVMGYLLSILFDVINKIIDYRIELFQYAFKADVINLKNSIENIPFIGNIISDKISIDESQLDSNVISKLKDIKYKQEEKERRKEHYFKQKN